MVLEVVLRICILLVVRDFSIYPEARPLILGQLRTPWHHDKHGHIPTCHLPDTCGTLDLVFSTGQEEDLRVGNIDISSLFGLDHFLLRLRLCRGMRPIKMLHPQSGAITIYFPLPRVEAFD